MFSKKFIKGFAILASSAVFSMSTMQSAYAAPGALAKAPLFLSSIVEPNVYFTLDDSGSMDWNTMVKDGTAGIAAFGGLPFIDSDDRAYYAPNFSRLYTSRGFLPPSGNDRTKLVFTGSPDFGTDFNAIVADEIAEWDRSWVARNHIGNTTYYDPSVKYVPWPGSKADGTPMYTNADPTKALKDPNQPLGESVDLTARYSYTSQSFNPPGPNNTFSIVNDNYYIPTYVIWDDDIKIPVDPGGEDPFDLVDTNLDGIIDSKDGMPAVPNGIMEIDDGRRFVEIAAGTPEMQNFANWFQYYRSRINATKLIVGTTINNTDASRMGMRWYNGTIAPVDVDTMSDDANKRNMLTRLYNLVIPARGTPARNALHASGNYFRTTGGGAPILPASQGGECQQNFNIIMSDGFWNGANPGVGNTDLDTSGVTDNGFDGDINESVDDGNYEDNFSDTLADVAMDNYESDLRTDLANRVPTQQDVDEANHQHLVTYTIAFGLSGTLDLSLNPEDLDTFPGWPEPQADQETTVDDMWHAAYNGRGEFLSAASTTELEASLGAAIADIAERTATAAAVSINSAKLTTQSVVYLAQFNTNRWQGDIQAFKIADLNTGVLNTTPEWQAQVQLNNRLSGGYPGANPRVILTHNGIDGVPFAWDSLSVAQQDDLKTDIIPPAGFTTEQVARARLDYLRGDRSNEGGVGFGFRERLSLLGDIVHAGPVFVGAPDLNWPDKAPFPTTAGSRYSDFKNGPAASRPGVVYTGSNDGKLHGFAEADGEEVIAYIANNLFSTNSSEGLHYLTEPNYKHRYYNDLTPTLSDVYADLNNGQGTAWQTILISGQRGGGRGIYALDVNDPATFKESNASKLVLWEFSNADDPDLGYTYSRPVIGMANNGRWVAIFGNGYNDTGDGKAKLFIVDIAGGTDGSWDSSDVIEIDTNSGDTTNRNGLSSPALADTDGDGDIDRVYAGDLRGQMWAFDLSGAITSSWGIPGNEPLFTTIGNQPITAKPTLAKHPTISDDGSNSPNLMVFFGSGQYLVDADKTSTDVNYFYGVWDRGIGDRNDSHLERQYFENGFTTWIDSNGDGLVQAGEQVPQRVLTRNVIDYAGGDFGWYFELPDSGERLVETPVVRGGVVFFNTFAPNTDACSVGGYGFRMAVDVVNGGSPLDPTVDVNGDGVIDDKDNASNGITTATVAGIRQEGYLPEPVFIEDIAYTAETPTKVIKLRKIPTGRFSWQELIQ
ncbi:MAG: PilC/PilY family type IV pilus protein [Gammaproteobacteria bacterium]|nr:PilC/PilY family type IV pilus protein [Gammaproteobacteria bacterium]